VTIVIAHRGASRAERENTVEAFRAARAMGAAMVELDARLLADGGLAVIHDPHLADLRAVALLRRDDLPAHVPLLAEALAACEGMDVNVEIKNDPGEPGHDPTTDVAERVADVVRAEGAADRVLVSSFHLPTAVRAHACGLASAWLVTRRSSETADVVDTVVAHGLVALHPSDRLVTADLVEACHARGVKVNVWTVDDPARMRVLAAWGVDGICTNVPDVAVAVLADR
jgi:glycerophosphoryl diester phosphodiesterase